MRTIVLSALACTLVASTIAVPAAWPADRTVGERVDDAKITAVLKSKLIGERLKNLVDVDVDTRDGIVHLQGTVPTAADKAQAERLARSTTGVRGVQNDLRVAGIESSPSASPRR